MKLNVRFERKARIEMLPLIDIVFLLLVFFIHAMLSMAVHRGVPVELPVSSTAEIDKKLILSVTIKADGTVFLDKLPVDLDDLTDALKAKTATLKNPGVLLFADNRIPYRDLFAVMDRIKMAGISRVSLQAEKDGTE